MIQPQQEMDHGRVAGHHHHRALRRIDAGALRQRIEKLMEGVHSGPLQHFSAALQGEGDPGEDVRTIGDLTVRRFSSPMTQPDSMSTSCMTMLVEP